jgi:hypothetical protein
MIEFRPIAIGQMPSGPPDPEVQNNTMLGYSGTAKVSLDFLGFALPESIITFPHSLQSKRILGSLGTFPVPISSELFIREVSPQLTTSPFPGTWGRASIYS